MDSAINESDKNVELNSLENKKNNSQLDDINEDELKSRLNCFKKIVLILAILVIISIVLLIIFIVKNNEKDEKLKKKDEEIKEKDGELKEKVEEIKREKYNKEILIEEDINENNYDIEFNYTINESAKYRICLYGPKAKNGGKGCVKCAERYFESGSIIDYRLGGRESGGEAGTDCGAYKGRGFNGAGLSKANFSDDFYIVAGGGGGNSESGDRGGDCQQDGEGRYGGKGAKTNMPGKGGGSNTPKGDGGEGVGGKGGGQTSASGQYCGGGGGSGYYGGGGGDYGDVDSNGAGGGGSSYCIESNGVICLQTSINMFEYSKLEIYKKVFER